MQRRTNLAAGALLATVTVLAGCGGGSSSGTSGSGSNNASQSPSAELTAAINKLDDGSTLTTTVKAGASAAQIKSFASSQGSSAPDSTVNALAGASISIEAQAASGKSLSDGASAYDVVLSAGGHQLIDFRDVSSVIYLQADFKDLLNTLNEATAYQQIEAEQSQLPAFAQDLIAGKWVSVPVATLKSLVGSASGSGSSGGQGSVVGALKSVLTGDTTVTRVSSGSTDTLKVTGNTKTTGTNLLQGLSKAVPLLSSLGSESIGTPANATTTLTATVNNGALSSLSVDVAQFAKKPTTSSVPIEASFAQSGPSISKPSGATPVDTASLTQLLGALGGGTGG